MSKVPQFKIDGVNSLKSMNIFNQVIQSKKPLALSIGRSNFTLSNYDAIWIKGKDSTGLSHIMDLILFELLYQHSDSEMLFSVLSLNFKDVVEVKDVNHCAYYVSKDSEADNYMKSLANEVKRRKTLMESKRVKSIDDYNRIVNESERLPYHITFIDGRFSFFYKQPLFKRYINSLIECRNVGVHLVIKTNTQDNEYEVLKRLNLMTISLQMFGQCKVEGVESQSVQPYIVMRPDTKLNAINQLDTLNKGVKA